MPLGVAQEKAPIFWDKNQQVSLGFMPLGVAQIPKSNY